MHAPDRRLIAVVVLALFVAACGSGEPARPGVDVTAINTDLGLGLKEKAAASPVGLIPRSTGLNFDDFETDFGPDFNFDFPDFDLPSRTPEDCEKPGPNVNPDKKAGPNVTSYDEDSATEATGFYPWYLQLEAKTPEGKPVAFENFIQRGLGGFNFNTIGGQDAYQFSESQSFRVGEQLVSQVITYEVVSDSGVEQPANPNNALGETRPGAGLFLEEIQTTTITPSDDPSEPQEEQTSVFSPNPSIQLLGFPVGPGQEIASTGFDSSGGHVNPQAPDAPDDSAYETSLTVEATVVDREQIEVCGERIEAWKVDGRRTFNMSGDLDDDPSTPPERRTDVENYDYWVATQFGSRIVKEFIEYPIEDPVFSLTQFLANTDPPSKK